jgi:hypothetical protein
MASEQIIASNWGGLFPNYQRYFELMPEAARISRSNVSN